VTSRRGESADAGVLRHAIGDVEPVEDPLGLRVADPQLHVALARQSPEGLAQQGSEGGELVERQPGGVDREQRLQAVGDTLQVGRSEGGQSIAPSAAW